MFFAVSAMVRTHSVDAIAAALGVSRATVYRHLTAP
ncbi:helix-turn-helix domain-containing protein [Micromonospora arida]